MGKKDPRGSSPSPPSVCLADQETVPCIIHHVYAFWQKTDQYKQQNVKESLWQREREREGRGRDMVKDCAIRYLCNRPHAKIIQAWSEINVRAWKLWRNPMLSCGPERQNKTYKKEAQMHEGCILRACVCVKNAKWIDRSCTDHRCAQRQMGEKRQLDNTSIIQLPQCAYLYLW